MTIDGTPPLDAQPVRPRASRVDRRRTFRRRRLLVAVGVLVVLLAIPVLWFVVEAYPIGGSGKPVVFQVHKGESMDQVASTLAAKGVIGSARAFRLDLLFFGSPSVQPGWYELPTSSSFSSVRGVLSNGPNAIVLGVYVGQTTLEIAQSLLAIESPQFATNFRALALSGAVHSPYQPSPGASLEGLIAPGLYVLAPGETPRTLLQHMVARFNARAATQGLLPTTTAHGLDAYGLVTVASIVEKEGYLPRNMPRTATVIYNRLAIGSPLQMDSTVLYATGQDGGTVSHATEQIQSPFNTYLHTGLTPSPICIPSTEAIDAALHPAPGPWLYFTLVDQSGTMAFSTTFAEQLANEALGRRNGV